MLAMQAANLVLAQVNVTIFSAILVTILSQTLGMEHVIHVKVTARRAQTVPIVILALMESVCKKTLDVLQNAQEILH